ncbi:hypothetical protein GCM10025864_30230 [Luteimicrobium album]|uniref:ABC transmembrane type-1 domain-containing protein n=1 Tax=Luteimicrobium album TaxID=1054550 RepID=A0ABQ6I654_9MICO|nr:ABC transporter permease [Luteimicrobium album]GMA25264.1 hypothetical protein GCM10025864_30230 [Luteimicrobium album]
MSAQLPELSEPGTGPTAPATDIAPRRGTWRAFCRRPLGVVAGALLLLVVAAVLLAPVLASQDPSTADLASAFGGPTAGHPLGFDSAGRDVLSRLLYGGRTTLGGAVLAVAVALVLGVPTGLVAGYRGRRFDAAASWLTNLVMSLPAMVVLLASRAILGPTVWVLMVVMGVLVAPSFYRLTRGVVADVRGELYVDAARVAGLSDTRIVGRHVLVVVRAPIVIQAALVAGVAIGLQAGLEFLGIGSGDSPTWGAMLNEAFQNIQRDPRLMLWPGLALGVTSACLVLVASALRDALEGRAHAPRGPRAVGRPGPRRGRTRPWAPPARAATSCPCATSPCSTGPTTTPPRSSTASTWTSVRARSWGWSASRARARPRPRSPCSASCPTAAASAAGP